MQGVVQEKKNHAKMTEGNRLMAELIELKTKAFAPQKQSKFHQKSFNAKTEELQESMEQSGERVRRLGEWVAILEESKKPAKLTPEVLADHFQAYMIARNVACGPGDAKAYVDHLNMVRSREENCTKSTKLVLKHQMPLSGLI